MKPVQGIAILLKMNDPPSEAKSVPLGEKKKTWKTQETKGCYVERLIFNEILYIINPGNRT